MATATDQDQSARPERNHVPGDGNMWVFVLGDLVIFGGYFLIFMIHRHQERDLFLESQQHVSLTVGVINTLVLLASSWFIATSVQATRTGRYQRAVRLTLLGGGCGVLFLAIKAYEWTTKIVQGYTFPSNGFFMFYYLLTGVHVFHVALGLVFLGVTLAELRGARRVAMVETSATYWHMVDLLWIVIFALVYVMR